MAYSVAVGSGAPLLLRVIAVDFSYYRGAVGIGVAVYEGDLRHVLRQSFTLSWASHKIAATCASRRCLMRAIERSLRGFHVRERLEQGQIRSFLRLLRGRGLRVSYLLATKYTSVVISRIAQRGFHGINVIVYDELSGDEAVRAEEIKRGLKERRLSIIGEIRGKNYLVALSDIAAYLAALDNYLSKYPPDDEEGRRAEEMKEELIELLKPYNLELL